MNATQLNQAVVVLIMFSSTTLASDNKPWNTQGSGTPPPASQPATAPQGQPSLQTVNPSEWNGGQGQPPVVQYSYPQAPMIIIPNPSPSTSVSTKIEQDTLLGMTPEEIRRFRSDYRERVDATVDKDPLLRTRTVEVDLSAGSKIPSVSMVAGQMSSLNFIDSLGNPWPVRGVLWGDKGSFTLVPPPMGDPSAPQSIIAANANVEIGSTTASILLAGQGTPVMIKLTASRGVHDARVDLKLNQIGPNSQGLPVSRGLTEQAADTIMVSVLDGIIPKGFKNLPTGRDDVRAYTLGERLYVRTWHDILSPRYDAIVHGAGGVRVYRFEQASQVLLISIQGRTTMMNLGEATQ